MKVILYSLLVSSLLLSLTACLKAESRYTDLTAPQAKELIDKNLKNPDFVILDVRTPQEYNQSHIKGAINIDYFGSDFQMRINSLDKRKTYLLHCLSGSRSIQALQTLLSAPLAHIYHLQTGIKGWIDAGYPVSH